MNTITIEDLTRILVDCAGETDEAGLGIDIIDRRFADLGYDSLAIMEAVNGIEQEFGVHVPDELMAEMTTPRAILAVVNGDLPGAP